MPKVTTAPHLPLLSRVGAAPMRSEPAQPASSTAISTHARTTLLRRARRHLTTVTLRSDLAGCRTTPIGAKIGRFGKNRDTVAMDMIGRQLSRYRLLQEVGQGGMA